MLSFQVNDKTPALDRRKNQMNNFYETHCNCNRLIITLMIKATPEGDPGPRRATLLRTFGRDKMIIEEIEQKIAIPFS